MTDCTIEWNVLSLTEWESRFARIRRSNLLQSYPYAQASAKTHHHKVRWGLIKIDGQEAGLVQIFETGLFGKALHTVTLDRGPLWLPGFGEDFHQEIFFQTFDQLFPRRFGRRRRIIPETGAPQLIHTSFRPVETIKPYQTIWLDLTLSEEQLKADLKKSWRNALGKAERENVRVEWNEGGAGLLWILKHHDAHRTMNNFRAASLKLIRRLVVFCGARGETLSGRAFVGNEPVAGVLFFRHGTSATYQIGWSGDQGRKVNAHHLLLWQAMLTLKEQGVQDMDLGGINDVAEGVRTFKMGMGGTTAALSGLYS